MKGKNRRVILFYSYFCTIIGFNMGFLYIIFKWNLFLCNYYLRYSIYASRVNLLKEMS